jgi:hypothetical protein
MNIKVEGTLRQRTRINFLFFTVAGSWKETPFSVLRTLGGRVVVDLPAEVKLNLEYGLASAGVTQSVWARFTWRGTTLWKEEIVGRGLEQTNFPFSLQPIKGVILKGAVSVSA